MAASMVLFLDGNSEHGAQVWEKSDLKKKIEMSAYIKKCLKQVK